MRVHHIRNATTLIESGNFKLLIDPMIGKKGSAAPPFSYLRFKPLKNPICDLPKGALELIYSATHCLITHRHADHLDSEAIRYLRDKQIPITCSIRDQEELKNKGLNICTALDYWNLTNFVGGTIEGIPARHGYGFVAKPMGHVMGYFLRLPNEPSVYLSSDTIYTKDVKKVLTQYKPDIAILACGSAQLDMFQPLLMTMKDIIHFVTDAPKEVICNHLEALNHCPNTRDQLRTNLQSIGIIEKAWIPDDGEFKDY